MAKPLTEPQLRLLRRIVGNDSGETRLANARDRSVAGVLEARGLVVRVAGAYFAATGRGRNVLENELGRRIATRSAEGGSGRYESDVPVEPFRRRVEALRGRGITFASMAEGLDWTKEQAGSIVGDGQRLRRTVGIDEAYDMAYPGRRRRVRRETAIHLMTFLDVDPVDVGL